MQILIDNGHGSDTAGKRSPDGRLMEYAWARDVAKRLEQALWAMGCEARRIVPEETDVALSARCRRVNEICSRHGAKNCLLVSLHVNAARSDGKWYEAGGWTVWVAPNASAGSKRLAQLLYDAAADRGLRGNRYVPACRYWTGNYAIVRDTACPAVLTENLFMDNRAEVDYLLSEGGRQAIADLHAEGILRYIKGL